MSIKVYEVWLENDDQPVFKTHSKLKAIEAKTEWQFKCISRNVWIEEKEI